MSNENNLWVSQNKEHLQIPYSEYTTLMKKVEEVQRLRSIRDEVVSQLKAFLGESGAAAAGSAAPAPASSAPEPAPAPQPVAQEPKPVQKEVQQPQPQAAEPSASGNVDVPPIKKVIAEHFHKVDESGRLFSVFRQYYSCLNDQCGGTVRVTMKDGVCSLWNYDEWEEFAFTDIYDGCLRICIDSRYKSKLQSLNLCEAPRLLSGRGSLVCAKVDDLNNTMLDAMANAFREIGLAAS